MFPSTEWDYRAPTLAEQVDHLRATWDGPRCPHGTPLNAPGPDLICNSCEAEMAREEEEARAMEALDERLALGFGHEDPVGPDRHYVDRQVRLGLRDRAEPQTDDIPF